MAHFNDVLPPFDLTTAVVLITGGSSGIGLGLVDEFTQRGARVLIAGRREPQLLSVQSQYGLAKVPHYYVADVGKEADRIRLFQQATNDHPDLNILINNAGIQRRGDPRQVVHEPWSVRQEELDINLSGPIHLTSLFLPHMLALTRPSAVVQVTSGLAFSPFTAGPVYSASKAALHMWTTAMRPLLADTACRMVELIPPAVKSNLGGGAHHGEDCAEFCKYMVDRFAEGKLEMGFKTSETRRTASREELETTQFMIIEAFKLPTFGTK